MCANERHDSVLTLLFMYKLHTALNQSLDAVEHEIGHTNAIAATMKFQQFNLAKCGECGACGAKSTSIYNVNTHAMLDPPTVAVTL